MANCLHLGFEWQCFSTLIGKYVCRYATGRNPPATQFTQVCLFDLFNFYINFYKMNRIHFLNSKLIIKEINHKNHCVPHLSIFSPRVHLSLQYKIYVGAERTFQAVINHTLQRKQV